MTTRRLAAINRKTRILRLAAQGWSVRQIATDAGTTTAYVNMVLRQSRREREEKAA